MSCRGMSFVEVLLGCALLLVIVGPLGLLLSQASRETHASLDEFLAALYLSEVVDQVASLPYERLPLTQGALDLSATRPVLLAPGDPGSALHLTPLAHPLLGRTVRVSEVPSPRASLKEVRATVTLAQPSGAPRTLDLVTYVGRGRRPAYEPGR